eukprot:6470624-Prymnesium_polylepis.2
MGGTRCVGTVATCGGAYSLIGTIDGAESATTSRRRLLAGISSVHSSLSNEVSNAQRGAGARRRRVGGGGVAGGAGAARADALCHGRERRGLALCGCPIWDFLRVPA